MVISDSKPNISSTTTLRLFYPTSNSTYAPTTGKYRQTKLVEGISRQLDGQFWDDDATLPMLGTTKIKKDKQYSACGYEIGYYTCDSKCPQVQHWRIDCGRAECPICGGAWIHRRTKESAERINQIGLLVTHPYRHVVLSSPTDWDGKGLEKIIKYLFTGDYGVALVKHPYRFRDKETGAQIRWRNCDINPNSELAIPSLAIHSLHFHLIVSGHLRNATKFHNATDWIYVNLSAEAKKRNPKHRGYLTPNDVRRTLGYSLSHTAIEGRKQTVRYFGFLANNQLEVHKKTIYQARLCETCKCPLTKWKNSSYGPVMVENKQKVILKFYRFRTKDG